MGEKTNKPKPLQKMTCGAATAVLLTMFFLLVAVLCCKSSILYITNQHHFTLSLTQCYGVLQLPITTLVPPIRLSACTF